VHKRPSGALTRSRCVKLFCLLILTTLPILLFRAHVFRQVTYIGNPDRLNSHLKILQLHVDDITTGDLQAWSEYEMLGYDSFTMPYTFPNPLTYLTAWCGARNLYITAGYVSVMLLILSGFAAYAFLLHLTNTDHVSVIGAALYQFAAASVLSVSQNDLSFAVFILVPLLALVIRAVTFRNQPTSYCMAATLLFGLLHFTFLQYAAYALLFVGAYAAYRSFCLRSWAPTIVLAFAFLTACIAASPRVYGVGRAMAEYTRSSPSNPLADFDSVYAFQHVRPYQVFRWFDDTIFGAYPSDAAVTLRNNINLTEGFLLYTSAIVPFLVIRGTFRYGKARFGLLTTKANDAAFLFWAVTSTIAVILFKPAAHLLYLLFLRVDFTHARVLVVGLLPLVGLVALLLRDLRPQTPPGTHWFRVGLVGVLLAGFAVWGIEWLSLLYTGNLTSPIIPMRISHAALARIAGTALTYVLLMSALRFRKGTLPVIAYVTLCSTVLLQTIVGAEMHVNGAYTRSLAKAFVWGNLHAADVQDFQPPSEAARQTVQQRVESNEFRSAIVCPSEASSTFCGGHVPEFWKLRVVDGYYGLGVPTRLALLPWKGGLGLRTLSFQAPGELQWPLLGLLNVKYAILADRNFYRNRASSSGNAATRPEQVDTLRNPSPIFPRAFFARCIEPVADTEEDVRRMFDDSGSPRDLRATSYVEGPAGRRVFSTEGAISLIGRGDRLTLLLESGDSERFLVVNELYFPGWRAEIEGAPARVYATNSFMRGILVPPKVAKISLLFVPFVHTTPALVLYGLGIVLLPVGVVLLRRLGTPAADPSGD